MVTVKQKIATAVMLAMVETVKETTTEIDGCPSNVLFTAMSTSPLMTKIGVRMSIESYNTLVGDLIAAQVLNVSHNVLTAGPLCAEFLAYCEKRIAA